MNKKGTYWNQITDAENRQIALVCDASDAGSGGHLTYVQRMNSNTLNGMVFGMSEETVRRILNNSVNFVNYS